MLDTNILSELIRNPQGRVTARIREIGETQVATSIIVAAELRYGAARKGSARLAAQVEAVLGAIEILPFEEPADRVYAVLRTSLERKGLPIGGHDLLIAAQALSLGLTLVTANDREFARIDGLPCENWLA
ncbi:MAG: type II toxin-antitoxin system VapC family toxin [Bryobacteraceae bacterium]|nr:type II toxin-antitoxin system VapC family toxin [Bryobacteraceae bacterium]